MPSDDGVACCSEHHLIVVLFKFYSFRGTSPAHVAREGPYTAVTFCCQGMRRESGHWGERGKGAEGRREGASWQRSVTGVCGPSTAIGHIPPRERRASRRLHSGDLVLSRDLPYQVCSVSVGVIRWTGTPCQMVPRLQVVRIARFIVGWVQQGCTPHIFCFVPGCTPLPDPSQIRVNE